MSDNYDGPAMAQHIYRLREQIARDTAEIERLKAERDAALKALRFLLDHGAYLTERVPDELQAALDAARNAESIRNIPHICCKTCGKAMQIPCDDCLACERGEKP